MVGIASVGRGGDYPAMFYTRSESLDATISSRSDMRLEIGKVFPDVRLACGLLSRGNYGTRSVVSGFVPKDL